MSKFKTFLTQTLAIWRVELLRLRRSLIWSGFFFVFLTALSVYNGASFYRHQQENVKELTQQSTTWTQEQAQKTQRREQQLKEDNKALQPDKKIYRNPALLASSNNSLSTNCSFALNGVL